MAALQGHAQFGSANAVPLVANTPRTVARVKAATNQRVKILGYGIYFDGTSNSGTPVQVQLGRISADGTSPTAITVMPGEQELTETFQTSVATASVGNEPTYSNYMKTLAVHPQLGYEYLAPLGQEIVLAGGGMWGIVANAPAGVDARGYVLFEE